MVPAVRALRAAGLKVGVLCPMEQADFWAWLAGVVVIPYRRSDWVRRIAPRLKGQWKASLCWEHGFAANVFVQANLPVRLGPAEPGLRTKLTQVLTVAPPGPPAHRVRQFLQAVEEMGVATQHAEFFQPLIDRGNPNAGQARALVVADSDFGDSHEWPVDHWQALSHRMMEHGVEVSIAIGVGRRGLGQKLLDRLGGQAQAWETVPGWQPGLTEFDRVLAVDGTLPHLAGMAGASCATWFGPNDPTWRRPLGRQHLVIRRPVECAPCLSRKCRMDHRCMKELTADLAWKAVSDWLEAGRF